MAQAAIGVAGLGLQAFGALSANKAAGQQAGAIEAQARMARQVAGFNAFTIRQRGQTQKTNAKYSSFLAGFTLRQTAYETAVNSRLAEVEHQWSNAFANYQSAVGATKKRAFDISAKHVVTLAKEGTKRHSREGRRFTGRQRAATAAAGVLEAGSPIMAMAESAQFLELDRADMMVEAETEAGNLRYQGKLAKYEGDTAAKFTRFRAGVAKYQADVQNYTANQAGIIRAFDYRIQAFNFRASATDYKNQARLTQLYGEQEARGLLAQAGGVRSSAKASLFGDLGSIALSGANMAYQGVF
jgi:hypothetical protein